MIKRHLATRIFLAILCTTSLGHWARAVDQLTLDNVNVNPGATVSMNVIWSSTEAIDYLTTMFIITPVASAPAGEVSFSNTAINATTGTPAMPPLTNANYVFKGFSDDYNNFYPNNPASVSTTNWAYDTYNFADSADPSFDIPQSGIQLWTVLQFDASALASGTYQITLGSSQYTNSANPSGLTPTMTGGLITINQVPEPGTWVLAAMAASVIACATRRRKR